MVICDYWSLTSLPQHIDSSDEDYHLNEVFPNWVIVDLQEQ